MGMGKETEPAANGADPPSAKQEEEQQKRGVSANRVSNLPDEILHLILSFLPLEELVATSTLSRRWRRLWTLVPLCMEVVDVNVELLINGHRYPQVARGSHGDDVCSHCWVLQAIDGILARHQGPIRSFDLHWDSDCIECEFEHCKFYSPTRFNQSIVLWAETLAERGGVQDLGLHKHIPSCLLSCRFLCTVELSDFCPPYDDLPALPPNLRELTLNGNLHWDCDMHPLRALPQTVLACKSLCTLRLRNYELEESFGMQMPPNLRELTLCLVDITNQMLSRVLSTCQLLDTLDFTGVSCLENVRINSLSLKKLFFDWINHPRNSRNELVIEDAPNLEMLEVFVDTTVRIVHAPKLWLIRSNLSHCLKVLQQDGSTQNYSVKEFSVKVGSDDAPEIKRLLNLIRILS